MGGDPTTNGHRPQHAATEVVRALRTTSRAPLLLRGFAPLLVGIVLLVLMLRLAPSVAPEHIVQRPVTTTSVATSVTTTSSAATTVVP